MSRPKWCYCRLPIPSWGELHARWGPTAARTSQKNRGIDPDRIPMCMLAAFGTPREAITVPQQS